MRDITKLHPTLQTKVAELKSACEKAGLKIGIGECVRTVAEQDALYAKGRTTSGSIVTNAKGSTYSSMHQWGVAFDFYRNDGKGAYYDNDGFFTKVGKIGQGLGLEWGGSWTSIKDKPHFQLPNWGSTTSKLKKTYGTPTKFMATWTATTTTSTTTASTAETCDVNGVTLTKNNAIAGDFTLTKKYTMMSQPNEKGTAVATYNAGQVLRCYGWYTGEYAFMKNMTTGVVGYVNGNYLKKV